MPQTPFPKLLVFAEGTMERLFIKKNFSYAEVIPVSNGVSWSVAALCKQIVTLFKARNFFGDHIIVWVDRERRVESASFICSEIRTALVAAGAAPDRLHVLVCDLMTENVILSDQDFIRAEFDEPDYVYNSEGCGGKYRLTQMYEGAGRSYRPTFEGVNALKRIRIRRCAQVSPAVDAFANSLNIDCWWLG